MARKFRVVPVGSDRPWIRVVIAIVLVLVFALGGWGSYEYGRQSVLRISGDTHAQSRLLEANGRHLMQKLGALRQRNTELSGQLTYLRRSHEIDGDACQLVKKSLGNLQQENSGLREQLAFYRGIVSPKQSASGLQIYDFKVSRRARSPREYDFELLLVQSLHHSRLVRGRTEVQIDGVEGSARKSYELSDLAIGKKSKLSFSFKYFQELDGQLRLPKGFRPLRVSIKLLPGGHQPQVTQVYDWSKVEQRSSEG